MGQQSFGNFLKTKRLERELTLRHFAAMLHISPEYLCDVEKGRNPAPGNELLTRIEKNLCLDEREAAEMHGLAAARKRPAARFSIPEYIMENELVLVTLRSTAEMESEPG